MAETTKNQYKAGKPRYSRYYEYRVVDIYRLSTIFWVFPYWVHDHTIKDAGQVEEVVMLLNHPEELDRRLEQIKVDLLAGRIPQS